MLKIWRFLIVSVMMVLLSACGGGGNPSVSDGSSVLKKGSFSKVKGLSYKTSSGISGITDENGTFEYKEGDSIEFYIQGLNFGTVNAIFTVGATSFQKPALVLQALHALDDDGNLTNGITIPSDLVDKSIQLNRFAKTVNTDQVKIKLDEIKDDDAAYIDFLRKNGKLLQSKKWQLLQN